MDWHLKHPIFCIAAKVMITGDYLKTAIAIAKNVQILQPQDDEVGLNNIKNQDVEMS